MFLIADPYPSFLLINLKQDYPIDVEIDPPAAQNRWTVAFRIILALPVLLFLYLLQAGALWAIWAAVLVRGRIPRWLFDFQVGVNRFVARASAPEAHVPSTIRGRITWSMARASLSHLDS